MDKVIFCVLDTWAVTGLLSLERHGHPKNDASERLHLQDTGVIKPSVYGYAICDHCGTCPLNLNTCECIAFRVS